MDAAGSGFPDCTICLEQLKSSLCVLICGHVFHRTCIEQWFNTAQGAARRAATKECPCCKRKCSMSQIVNLHYHVLQGANDEPPLTGGPPTGVIHLDGTQDDVRQGQIAQLQRFVQQLQAAYQSCSERLMAAQEQLERQREAVQDAAARHELDRRNLEEQLASVTYRHSTKEREVAALKRQLNESDARIEELEEELEETARKLRETEASLESAMSCEGAPISTLVRGLNIDWVKSQVKLGAAGEKTITDRFAFLGRRYDEAVQACKQAQDQAEGLKKQAELQRTQLFELHAAVKALQAAPAKQQQANSKSAVPQQPAGAPPRLLASSSSSSSSSSASSENPPSSRAFFGLKRPLPPDAAKQPGRQPFVMRNELAPASNKALKTATGGAPGRSFFNPLGKASAGGASSSAGSAANATPRSLSVNNGSFIKTGYDAMGQVQHFKAAHTAPRPPPGNRK